MNHSFQTETAGGTCASPASDAWLFAQALLGKAAPSASSAAADERAKREQLTWLANISSEHESQLRRSLSEESDATADRAQLQWLAEISPSHESQLRRLLAVEAEAREAQGRIERLVEGSTLQEFQWDPGKHPRRGGAPNAGWFATTGGTGVTASTGRSVGKLDRAGRDGERDANGKHQVPPRMLELAGAWSQTRDQLDQYRRDIERLPSRIASERAQLGSGGRYAYVHTQNLANAEQDLETAKAQVPELEAQLRELEKEYHESGYDDVGYGTTTPGETFVDDTIFYLLQAIDQGSLRIAYTASNGKVVDLAAQGLGELSGWFAGSGGWRETYSKERFVDDFSDLPGEEVSGAES
jgi:hypothetical protein